MIRLMDMEEIFGASAKILSGGEKRKLSVGIALISRSKVHKFTNTQSHTHKNNSIFLNHLNNTATPKDKVYYSTKTCLELGFNVNLNPQL